MYTAILTIAENQWFAICHHRICQAVAFGVFLLQLKTIFRFSQHTIRQILTESSEHLDYSSYRKMSVGSKK